MKFVRSAISVLVALVLGSAFALGLTGASAATQPDLDCDNFLSQQEAQQVFEQRDEDVFRLDADDDGVACEALAAEPTQQDSNCSDFASQQEAQQVFEQRDEDVFRLDADNDGTACEALPAATGGAEPSASAGDGTAQEAPAPVGGVAAGGGGTATGNGINAGAIGAGGAAFLILAGAVLLLVRKLRRTS